MVRKKEKKKLRIRIFIGFLIMVVIAAFVYRSIITPENHRIFEKEYDDKTSSYSSLKTTPDSSGDRTTPIPLSTEPDYTVSISPDKLNSPNAILIRSKDQTILMHKDSEEKIYPASLTKMMTAIVAIENLPDLEEEIKLINSMFQGLYEADASMVGFQPGEQVRAIDLLYGVMLPSGAECCIGLADQNIIGGEILGGKTGYTDALAVYNSIRKQ